MLLDVYADAGLTGMAQVDLDLHNNRHQPLLALSTMAYEVLGVIAARLEREGRSADSSRVRCLAAPLRGRRSSDHRCSLCDELA